MRHTRYKIVPKRYQEEETEMKRREERRPLTVKTVPYIFWFSTIPATRWIPAFFPQREKNAGIQVME
jgi:hypothetical protein